MNPKKIKQFLTRSKQGFPLYFQQKENKKNKKL